MSTHLDNSVAATLEIDAFANIRNMPKLSQQKAGQRLHAAIARQVPVHLRFQITQVHAAVQVEGLRGHARSAAHAHIELILHLADQLFQCVLHSYQANRRSMFIDDNRQMPPTLLELMQQVEHRLGLRHYQDVAHDLAQLQSAR